MKMSPDLTHKGFYTKRRGTENDKSLHRTYRKIDSEISHRVNFNGYFSEERAAIG